MTVVPTNPKETDMHELRTYPSLLAITPGKSNINPTNDRYLSMTMEQINNELNEHRDASLNQNHEMTHELLIGDIGELVEMVKERHPTCHVVVLHGCNCMNNMGAGLAKRIKQLYPAAMRADQRTKSHDRNKLGTCSGETIDSNLTVLNLYTQYAYGGGSVNVNYDAMRRVFDYVVRGATVDYIFMIPKYIGCGLAGGDINIVTPMIEEAFKDCAYYLFDK